MLNSIWIAPIAALTMMQPMPTQIRVKVFPHLYDYAPQGLEVDSTTVVLRSASSCEIDEGDTAKSASTGILVQNVPSLDVTLTLSSLTTPLWYNCVGPISVVRSGDVPSYSYPGPIYAHAGIDGPELIEVKDLNDYLRGVLPAEMDSFFPSEALKAQAVAARTYAQFHIAYAQATATNPIFFDVDDTVFYQAYTGTLDEKPATDQAIDDTGSEVMTYNDQVIQAFFSASAGGYTEDASHVWPVNAPYCQSKPETFSDADPWKTQILLTAINQKLFAEHVISSSNPVVDILVKDANRWASGRASHVTLTLRDGTSSDVDAISFRRVFDLRSTLFWIQHAGDEIVFIGQGFGHGVGMSQDGARVLATKQGLDYRAILNFYYTNIKIQ